MKKILKTLIATSFVFITLFSLTACGSPIVEFAKNNNHVVGGIEGKSDLENALFIKQEKFYYGDETTEAKYISYKMTPLYFKITIKSEIPEGAPRGIQMLVTGPVDTVYYFTSTNLEGSENPPESFETDELPPKVFEAGFKDGKMIFVLDYMNETGDPFPDHKFTVTYYSIKGKKLSKETIDIKIIK